MPGPYIVFFASGSVALNVRTRTILDHFLVAFPSCPGKVYVIGHTDRSGTASFNLALSRRRAAAVARYLAAHGFSMRAVTQQSFGSSRPLNGSPGKPHVSENRRVEVIVGPDLDH